MRLDLIKVFLLILVSPPLVRLLTKYINYNKMESKDTQGNQLFRESKPSHYTDYTTAKARHRDEAAYHKQDSPPSGPTPAHTPTC